MKQLQKYIDQKNWKVETKFIVSFMVTAIIAAAAGFILWNIVQFFALKSTEWMITFIGYAVVIAYVYDFLYMANHDFHDFCD